MKEKFANLKLAQKIAIRLCSILVVIFFIFIVTTVILLRSAIKESTSQEITATAKLNGVQIQQIFDECCKVNATIADYMETVYATLSETEQTEPSGIMSQVQPELELSRIAAQAEEFMIVNADNTATSDNGVYGVGVMFEPYGFSIQETDIPQYSFYMDGRNGKAVMSDLLGDYATYSKEDYYKNAVEKRTTVYTEPFLFEGDWTVTISTPIIYNNKVMGVVISDVALKEFDKINSSSDQYPSMYANIQSDLGTLLYDSRDNVESGQNTSEFYKKESDYQKFLTESAKGTAFSITTLSLDGSTLERYYYPISAGDATWWSLTGVLEKEVLKTSTTATYILIVIAIASVIIIAIMITSILKKMLKPIGEVVTAAESLSKGNLNVALEAKSRDEIGVLSEAFDKTIRFLKTLINDISRVLNEISNNNLDVETNTEYVGDFVAIQNSVTNIVSNLNNVMIEILQSAEQVANGAEGLSDASQSLAEGSTDQASAVEELFALINETTEQVTNTEKSVRQASVQVEEVGSEVTHSNNEMKGMVQAMSEITETSKQIEMITQSIESIASQTNLLSLNAAIEAARAGDAGKGFAVVAYEIRELAGQSAEAARNTRGLIENSLNAVEKGTTMAAKMEKSLNILVDKIKLVVDSMSSIITITSLQTEAMKQVNQGIEQISGVVEGNSAVAEESAATSEELSAQAQSFNEITSKFTLKK